MSRLTEEQRKLLLEYAKAFVSHLPRSRTFAISELMPLEKKIEAFCGAEWYGDVIPWRKHVLQIYGHDPDNGEVHLFYYVNTKTGEIEEF